MKSLVSHNRYTDNFYRPYPQFSVKSEDGLYESEDDETFISSPISNPESPFSIDELVTIDFSDLFNLQRHEQEDRKDELQVILEQVRRESLESLESLESTCNFTTPSHMEMHHHHVHQTLPQHPPPMAYPSYEHVMYDSIAYERVAYEATQPPTPPPKIPTSLPTHHNDEPSGKCLYPLLFTQHLLHLKLN